MNNKNIITTTNLLRSLDLISLKNIDVVANLIRTIGLTAVPLVSMGDDIIFTNERMDQAGMFQYPLQLAEALIYLSSYSINSYCEIGICQGAAFLFIFEYLKRFNLGLNAVGIDIDSNWPDIEIRPFINYKTGTSDMVKGEKFDLCFIDSDHTYKTTKQDWENVGQYSKICMFHDIQDVPWPDVGRFWNEIKMGKKFVEFLISPPGMMTMGIGILFNDCL